MCELKNHTTVTNMSRCSLIVLALAIFILISARITTVSGDCTSLEKSFGIRLFYSTLVLGSSNEIVTVQNPDDSDYQLWQLAPAARLGAFNIINKHNGKALDVTGSSSTGYNATLSDLTDSATQHWYINWENTITNAGLISYSLDIPESNYFAGNYVQLINRYDASGVDNEKFIFNYRS